MNNNKTIMIGSLVRDRAWILKVFLGRLLMLDYNLQNIGLWFFVNDSTDDSLNILNTFRKDHGTKFKFISIEEENYGNPTNIRRGDHRRILYKALADMRNILIDRFIQSGLEYYFSVDCDILLEPESLEQLLLLLDAPKYEMASALIYNDYNIGNIGNIMNVPSELNRPKHIKLKDKENEVNLIECDLSGAAIMFERGLLLNNRYRYEFDGIGEDWGLHKKTWKDQKKIISIRGIAEHLMRKKDR